MAPISVAVTLLGMWLSQKGERQRRSESDQHLHNAMFGYQEGATKVPGIYDIVVADGNGGNLSAITQATRQAANNAVTTASATNRTVKELTEVVTEHMADDRLMWGELGTAIEALATGQAAAATTAEHVAVALRLDTATKAVQVKKSAPVRKAAPAKMVAKKKGRS